MLRKIAALVLILSSGAFLFNRWDKEPNPPSFPVVEKKSFVIVIPTFNDEAEIQSTLFSAFEQRYDPFRILIIDDRSTDATVEKGIECTRYLNQEHKTTLIQNQSHCGILGSIYNAVHSCSDHEIALILIGGDRLSSPYTLQELNATYANPETWMTYGSALEFPSYQKQKLSAKPISEKVSRNQLLRKSPWTYPNPFSFYTTLFKEIPIEDLFYRGRFYETGWEYAIGFSLLELSANHASPIKTPLYLNNQKSKIHQTLLPAFSIECENHIRNRPPLSPLTHLPFHSTSQQEKADLLIFSKDRPMELFALLESVQRHVLNIHQITVFYETSTQPFETGYLELKLQFPSVHFHRKSEDFKSQLMNTGFAPSYSSSPYIILAEDGVVATDLIHLGKIIPILEATQAYGLYLDLHKQLCYFSQLRRYQPLPISTPLPGLGSATPEAWQLSWARDDWNNRGSFQFALYRKANLAPLFAEIEFETPEELIQKWNESCDENTVGLFFTQPKAISLKKSENPNGELEKFLGGLKLDLTSFFHLCTPSRETPMEMSYIPRE